jgi:hypothetical protein
MELRSRDSFHEHSASQNWKQQLSRGERVWP